MLRTSIRNDAARSAAKNATYPYTRWKLSARHVRTVIECTECSRPRIVYSKKKLDLEQKTCIETIRDEKAYVCGSIIHINGLYVNWNLNCGMPIAGSFYKHPEWGLRCHHCSSRITNPELIKEFGVLVKRFHVVHMSLDQSR